MDIELSEDQRNAVKRMHNGCILCGATGTGKSRTALAYYYILFGGDWKALEQRDHDVHPMMNLTPKSKLYIITTAKKRNDCDWEKEALPFLFPNGVITVDSWNRIAKYKDVTGASFIFDEDHVTGDGKWVKAFLKIARTNKWVILSATPGDKWIDYWAVFVANGYFKNVSEFRMKHVIYRPYSNYPDIIGYKNKGHLMRLREEVLVDLEDIREATEHHENVLVQYDTVHYKEILRNRWNPWDDEPIESPTGLIYCLRRLVNTDPSRQVALLELFEKHPKLIIFYNFNYELKILRELYYGKDVKVAEWNGQKHEPIPDSKRWVYLVNYGAGAEGWNCTNTDTMIFFSMNYSYKTMLQATGRINRRNTPYSDLYYYHFKSRSNIDLAISQALREKKDFNERRYANKNFGK